MVGQKLQALSNGYPQPKDKAGPCILKRADGQTVKLVCLDCHRENFSSTQGFINHCRIAHKRDFKSHEEAAVHSGQPVEPADVKPAPSEEKTVSSVTPAPVVPTTQVHPLARSDVTEKDVYAALRSRLTESMKLYNEGKLPGVTSIPSAAKPIVSKTAKTEGFTPAAETPYLSQLLQRRKCAVNLRDVVADARTQISLDDLTPGEESEEVEHALILQDAAQERAAARTPVVMRMPARTTKSPAVTQSDARPSSNKGCAAHMSYVSPPNSIVGALPKAESDTPPLLDDDMDMEEANLSPHTLISNNAPSLVSDDGEYDDSDDGSSESEASDDLDAEPVPDAEINMDYEHDPRGIRRGSSGVSSSHALRKEQKDDAKHVTFVNPVKSKPKERRPRKATQ
jgi:ADA HAT complex component 1